MSKHTAGPWEVDRFVCRMNRSDVQHARENGKPDAKVGDELWWVARSIGPVSVSNNHWAGDYLDLSPEDICLVAAAPELLEALREIATHTRRSTLDPTDIVPTAGAILARAAIKKAEGTE